MDVTSDVSEFHWEGPETALLPGEALLSAIRGHHLGDHRLADLAHEFGVMYHRRLTGLDSGCGCRRAELVLAVDVWVGDHLPVPHPSATLHTETLGTVIDRLAYAQVHAYRLLMTVDVSDPRVHESWCQLAELVDNYTDLVTAIAQRSRRLPALGGGTR
ncbi:DUF4254 domain-containing protein [Nocardia sp. NPDC005366]|uniref:DUF4254 domain-containing protein n=1 Tax=Nocardia sp. NPDC005366 TaxID=3156878 RepID=UPI0033BB3493